MSKKIIKSLGSSKPLRMWIDGKCFNIKKFDYKSKKKIRETIIQAPDGAIKGESMEVEIKNEIDITVDDNGKFSLSFQLPSIYYMELVKFAEFDVKTLSEKTVTDISIPKHGDDGKLTITGDNEISIQQALGEIHSVVGAIRSKRPPLQFISIPLLSQEIKNNYEKFKNEILSDKAINGMDESIFIGSLKLHLTILVLTLCDEREKIEAINVLNEYKDNVLGPLLEKTGPLKIQVRGIECMNINYKQAHVLYANAKIINGTEDVNLQKIANDLSDYFYERGFSKEMKEEVKLHMTLINSKYRKESNSPSRRRWNKRTCFDATSIMEKYKDFVFGECNLDNIRLSLMQTTEEDGFYKSLSVVNL